MPRPGRSGPTETPLDEALRRCRGALASAALFSLALNLLMLAGPLYMLQVYDRVLTSGSVETLTLLSAMLAVAYLAAAALESIRTAITVRIGAWLAEALGPAFLRAGIAARLAGESGGAQALRDVAQIQTFVATQGMTAFFDAPWTPLFIAVIWLLHPWLGALALGVAVLLLALSLANELATRRPLKEANAGQIMGHRLAEAGIDAAETVHAMGMTPAVIGRWSARNAEIQRDLLRASERGAWISGVAKFARYCGQSGVLGLGALLVLRGEATPGVMIAASIMLGRALAPVDLAMSAWKNFSGARIAYQRLVALAEAHPAPPRRMALPRPRGGLEVRDLTALGPHGPLLRKVSFEAGPGEAVAVVGPSGAGKSTLCRHLVGLAAPQAGSVRLDGCEIAHWNPEELGPHVGFLSQEVGLFAGTIRENIARLSDAPDEMVAEAALLAHAHEMIAQLPEGYDTVIGDRGAGLSAGQRQRIGLARAVFGSPTLIVLDEPNSNLDQAGEAALGAAILELKRRGATLVIVGHRPSTLSQSDKILLLRGGAVQIFGPRGEVLDAMREAAAAKIDGDAPAPGPARRAGGETP